jgi:hypothetical protein
LVVHLAGLKAEQTVEKKELQMVEKKVEQTVEKKD